VREANNLDDIVANRLRAILTATDHGVPDRPPTLSATTGSWCPDSGPLKWTDIVPSWPDDPLRDDAFTYRPPPAEPVADARSPAVDVQTHPPAADAQRQLPAVDPPAQPLVADALGQSLLLDLQMQSSVVDGNAQPPSFDVQAPSPVAAVPMQPPGANASTRPPGANASARPAGVDVQAHPPDTEVHAHPPGDDAHRLSGVDVQALPPETEVHAHPPSGDAHQLLGVELHALPPETEVQAHPSGGDAHRLSGDDAQTCPPSGDASDQLAGSAAHPQPPGIDEYGYGQSLGADGRIRPPAADALTEQSHDGWSVESPAEPSGITSSTRQIDPSAWTAVRRPWRADTTPTGAAGADVDAEADLDVDALGFVDATVRPQWEQPTMAEVEPEHASFEASPDPAVRRLSGPGAFETGRGRLGAFDPGRRGVKALAAVAVVVVLIAAVLAWRSRPRVDPVTVPPMPESADTTASPGSASGVAAGGDPVASRGTAGTEVVVAVGGKVHKPGLVRLPPGARVADALAAAGGANPGVDVALLNLARKVVDGELIMVGVTPPPGVAAANGAAAPAAGGGAPAGGPVNLNTATLADLDTLPGVGPVLAQRILDAREAQGGFKSVSDLRKVNGIGDSRYEQLKDLVVV